MLDETDPIHPTFIAPYVAEGGETLTFKLIVTNDSGESDPDFVAITVTNINNLPVADAGENSTIKEGATATLDGSYSYDPEGDAISFDWTQIAGPIVTLLPSNPVEQPTFSAPIAAGATLVFQLQVSDGKETSTPSPLPDPGLPDDDIVAVKIVLNSAPVAVAGPDGTKDQGNAVTLDGSASHGSDGGDTLSYQWTQIGGPAVALDDDTSATPSFTAPAVGPGGELLIFSMIVTDDDPINPLPSSPDEVEINIRNANDPPSCELAFASVDKLWPPNHKMKEVEIEGVMDEDSVYNQITLSVSGVTEDEPVNGLGDGDTSPDAIVQDGDPRDSVLLRAERSGGGNGRVYAMSFSADDGFESCASSVTVGVPHSRKSIPVDDGPVYDSTQQP